MPHITFATSKTKTLVANMTITGAVASGSLIKITSNGHGLETGDIVQITGVTGTVEANGQWVVTRVDANNFTLNLSTFSNAYVSGGTAKHIGFATASQAVDNTVYSTVPSFTLQARIEELTSGANARVVYEDSAAGDFSDAQPLTAFEAKGNIGDTGTLGSFQTGSSVENFDKMFTAKYYDLPDAVMASANNKFRLKVFISGGAGKSAVFSGWLD